MRILHLLARHDWSGPAPTVAALALAQRARGHQVAVAVDRTAGDDASNRLRALDLLDDGPLTLSPADHPGRVVQDIRRLRSRAFDVVHCHTPHDHWIGWWGVPPGAALVRSIHAAKDLTGFVAPADAMTAPWELLLRRLAHRNVALLPPLPDPNIVRAASRSGIAVFSLDPDARDRMGRALQPLLDDRPNSAITTTGPGAGLAGTPDVALSLDTRDGLGERFLVDARAAGAYTIAIDHEGLATVADAVADPGAESIADVLKARVPRALASLDGDAVASELETVYARART